MASAFTSRAGAKRPSVEPDDTDKPNQSSPRALKRQRVSRACDQCRTARERCDGIQPTCFPCASQHRSCSWQEPKKKRGVQTGYMRTLETALGWVFDKIPGSEAALHGLLTHEGGQGRSLVLGRDPTTANRLHKRWMRSMVHKEIDQILSGGDATNAKFDKMASPNDDSDSGADEVDDSEYSRELKHLAVSKPLDFAKKKDFPGGPDVGPAAVKSSYLASSVEGNRAVKQYLQSSPRDQLIPTLTLPSYHWRLVDIYSNYTHCWFPILEKHDLLKTSYSYTDEGIRMTNDNPELSAHAELWAALALAAYQDRANRSTDAGDYPHDLKSPDEFYRIARNLIPAEDGPFVSKHVNALLLLALVKIGQHKLDAAWILVGLACRVALSLGMHQGFVPKGSRRAHHTYMGCFILDTVLAARLNRPPHLRTDDAQPRISLLEDDIDEWQHWTPCSGFGPQQRDEMPHRNPTHAISSFNYLYGIHKVLSSNLFTTREGAFPDETGFSLQIQHAISTSKLRPFNNFIMNGGQPTAQLPSLYLLRLAFLGTGARLQSLPDSVPLDMLELLEEYTYEFGTCGASPLVAIYGVLISQNYNIETLSPDAKARWSQIRDAVTVVWQTEDDGTDRQGKNQQLPSLSTHPQHQHQPQTGAQLSQQSHRNDVPGSHTSQQLRTPTSYYAGSSADQQTSSADLAGELYIPQRQEVAPQPNSGATITAPIFDNSGFHAMGPPLSFPQQTRQNFGSAATLDYDAILDDIAALDRSDSQFMANLGFVPGSSVNKLLAPDFMSGFS